jgi:hypothetical protein
VVGQSTLVIVPQPPATSSRQICRALPLQEPVPGWHAAAGHVQAPGVPLPPGATQVCWVEGQLCAAVKKKQPLAASTEQVWKVVPPFTGQNVCPTVPPVHPGAGLQTQLATFCESWHVSNPALQVSVCIHPGQPPASVTHVSGCPVVGLQRCSPAVQSGEAGQAQGGFVPTVAAAGSQTCAPGQVKSSQKRQLFASAVHT